MLAKLLDLGAAASERREVAVTKEEFLLGRGADCDLRLGSKAISRHHCLLRFQPGEMILVDLGSANGTFVNGQRVRSQAPLKHGDEIALGEYRFQIETQQSGIDWGAMRPGDSQVRTVRFKDMKSALQPDQPEKDEGHPPGEAGGL
jgi:pSer/pThr/pTyr-binding forkhead associated (FHA) protein